MFSPVSIYSLEVVLYTYHDWSYTDGDGAATTFMCSRACGGQPTACIVLSHFHGGEAKSQLRYTYQQMDKVTSPIIAQM